MHMTLCRFVFLVIFIICHSYSLCFAEEESLQSYSLDKIEKDLQSQISISDVEQIKREDLTKLEDKKKESISSEIDVSHENEALIGPDALVRVDKVEECVSTTILS